MRIKMLLFVLSVSYSTIAMKRLREEEQSVVFYNAQIEHAYTGEVEWWAGLPTDVWQEIILKIDEPYLTPYIRSLSHVRSVSKFFNNLLSDQMMGKRLKEMHYSAISLGVCLSNVVYTNDMSGIWVKALVYAGAHKDTRRFSDSTPLHTAVKKGHVKAVQLLLDTDFYNNQQDFYKMTPLHCAAKEGYIDCVKLLLNANVENDIQDRDGWTPLHFAANGGHIEIAQLLLNAGANKDVKNYAFDTAAQIAREAGYRKLAKIIRRYKIDL
jgi:hypothetical protein